MTLSEFDRRCRGWHRRNTEAWRRTRVVATILLNAHRDPQKTPAFVPEEWMPLLGDVLPQAPTPLTAEQVEEEFTRLARLDADILV